MKPFKVLACLGVFALVVQLFSDTATRDVPGPTKGTFKIPGMTKVFTYVNAVPAHTNYPAEGGTNVWRGPQPPPLPSVHIDDPILVKIGEDSYELIAGTNDTFRTKHKPEIRKGKAGDWIIRFP